MIQNQEKQKCLRYSGCERLGQGYKVPVVPPLGLKTQFCCQNRPCPPCPCTTHSRQLLDIAAATLTDSNCLLPKGLIPQVNNRGAFSLTGTNPNTPTASYTPYFDPLTCRVSQSFPGWDNSRLTCTQAPKALLLPVDSIATHILPNDDDELYPFIK